MGYNNKRDLFCSMLGVQSAYDYSHQAVAAAQDDEADDDDDDDDGDDDGDDGCYDEGDEPPYTC